VTHPFHPWHDREYVFLAVRQTWAEQRVFFLDEDGVQHSMPLGWTDAAELDMFVVIAQGRCPFRIGDLLGLADLLQRLESGASESV
jgi:hypothetical protein